MSIFQEIISYLKNVIDLPDSHFYDISRKGELYQNINSDQMDYPAILFFESATYSSTLNQDEVDLKNEIRMNSDFFIQIFSNDIDDMIEVEETIKSHFAIPQELTVVCDDERVRAVSIVFNADEKIERENSISGIVNSTLSMKYIDMILPKKVENPIKVELDKNTQLCVMKHLCLLDSTLSDIEKELKKTPQDADAYEKLNAQCKDIEEQLSSMYTFENLCAEKIVTADHGFTLCYAFMVQNKWDIALATEAYKQKHEKERKADEEKEARANEIKQRFSKKGDKELNRYTDAVIEDIKSKLRINFPVDFYGGSSFIDFYRLDALEELKFPNILVYTDSNYTFANKSYTNIDSNGMPVFHNYSTNAFPIEYGIKIGIMTKEQEQADEIEKQLKNLYTDEVQIKVPDTAIEGEFCPIKLVINPDVAIVNKSFNAEEYGCTISHTVIPFKKYPSVYHPYQYNFLKDIGNDQRLQFRLLQQAEFLMLCDSKIRNEAISQLNSEYKNLFTLSQKKSLFDSVLGAIGSAFESQEYKQLKECFKNRRPIDRNLFDKALSKITSVYPCLYDKMMQGWTVEQIYDDLNKYADLFNKKWNNICNGVSMFACQSMFAQLGMSGDKNQPTERIHKGLMFYIDKMANDPYCTLKDAKEAYDEQLRIEEEERIARERHIQEVSNDWSESFRGRSSSSGGFFSNMMSTASGVVLGNKMSGNSKRKDDRRDFMGTAGCMYGKKKDGWTVHCDMRCPLYDKCTRARGRR